MVWSMTPTATTPTSVGKHASGLAAAKMAVALVMMFLCAYGHGPKARMVVLLNMVWQVGPQGQIAPFQCRVAKGYREGLQGWTPPLPSPDGRWITFGDDARDYDVHLLDARTLQERRITWFGRRPRLGYTFVAARAVGWSANSREILLSVTPGEIDPDEGQQKILGAAYGFYIYDLPSGRVGRVPLPRRFQFAAWLPDGRLLGALPGPTPCDDKLLVFGVSSTLGTPVGALPGPIQIRTSAAGRWAIGGFLIGGCRHGESPKAEIAKVDLRTGSATVLVPPAPWTENQWPDLSPDGQHFSYTGRRGMVRGVPHECLFVGGRQIYSCPGRIDYQWVGSERIALACVKSPTPLAAELLTLDARTGRRLYRYSLSTAQGSAE